MSYNYSKYQVEINKLGHYYNKLHFDQYVYFLYQKMQKEELIEIKNSSWITLTQKGRLALSDGYLKYQKTLTPKKVIISLLTLQ